MPIRFRCGYCNQLLAIAKRKAGAETTCPHCGYTVTVPEEYSSEPAPQIEIVDLDVFSNPEPAASSTATEAARQHPNRPGSASRPAPTATPASTGERPLFKRDLGSLLGTVNSATSTPKPTPIPAASASTASALMQPENQIVLSIQKATLLAIAGVVLMGLSFAAGFLIASAR